MSCENFYELVISGTSDLLLDIKKMLTLLSGLTELMVHISTTEKEQGVHQLVGQAKRHATKIRPKAVEDDIFGRFSNLEKCRLDVAEDVISAVAVEMVDMDVHVKCGDSMLKSNRIICLFADRTRFTHFCALFN